MKVILSEEQIKKILSTGVINEAEGEASQVAAPSNPFAAIRYASDKINSILSTNNTSSWLSVVQQTYNEFNGPLFHSQYNQNNIIGQDRADCSGFVYSALRNAGYNVGNVRDFNTTTMITDPRFTNAISRGFRRIQWNGPADVNKLPPGTILAFRAGENGKRYGHAIILGANGKSYDYGNNKHSEYSPNLNQRYTAAWVPIA